MRGLLYQLCSSSRKVCSDWLDAKDRKEFALKEGPKRSNYLQQTLM